MALKPAGLGVRTHYSSTDPRYQGHDDDVMTIADRYMASDSPLMMRAEAAGRAFANERGLLNSSMAVRSAQGAVLDQVVPMASQTAGQGFQKNMAGLQYTQQRGLADQAYGHQRGLAEQAFGHQRRLDTLRFGQDMKLEGFRQRFNREQAALDRKLQSDLQAGRISFEEAQNAYERALRQQLQTGQLTHEAEQAIFDREHRVALAEMDRDLRLDLAGTEDELQRWKVEQERLENEAERQLKLQLDASGLEGEDRRGAESMLNNAFNDYADSQRSILSNPELPAEERNALLEGARRLLGMKIDYVSDLYQTPFDWPENVFQVSASSSETDTSTTTTTDQQRLRDSQAAAEDEALRRSREK